MHFQVTRTLPTKGFPGWRHPHHLKKGGTAISWMANILYKVGVVKSSHYDWQREQVPQLSPLVQNNFHKLWRYDKGVGGMMKSEPHRQELLRAPANHGEICQYTHSRLSRPPEMWLGQQVFQPDLKTLISDPGTWEHYYFAFLSFITLIVSTRSSTQF